MLHFFTWQQFFVAAALFTIVWYVVIFLLFFKDRVNFHFRSAPPEKLKREWDEELDDEDEDADDLIGEQAMPEGISEVEAHMIGFAPKVKDEVREDSRETQLGIVPDVLEELKTIFHILERENGTKEDFISLFGMAKAKYSAIAGTPNEAAINDYIRGNVLFPISDEELANLWN